MYFWSNNQIPDNYNGGIVIEFTVYKQCYLPLYYATYHCAICATAGVNRVAPSFHVLYCIEILYCIRPALNWIVFHHSLPCIYIYLYQYKPAGMRPSYTSILYTSLLAVEPGWNRTVI